MTAIDESNLQEYESAAACDDSFRVQLVELNNRSRWYSSQLWQVPMAYLGLTGIFLANTGDVGQGFRTIAFLGSAVLGCVVLWHIKRIKADQDRAVRNLQCVEARLLLPRSALLGKESGGSSVLPLVVAVVSAITVYGLVAVYSFRQ